MKSIGLILGIVLFSISMVPAQLTKDNHEKLLNRNAFDENFTIERAAALEFHKLINQYRNKNNLQQLTWDEDMWLAARNHCLYMNENNHLTHRQAKNSKRFSGNSPSDRYNFVMNGQATYSGMGENCLYNYSSRGDGLEKVAQNIAKESFEQWKNSPGHNANMLNSYYRSHGAAFFIGNGRVWGADLLAMGTKRNTPTCQPKKRKKRAKKRSLFAIKKEVNTAVLKSVLASCKNKVRITKKLSEQARRKSRSIIHVRPKTRTRQDVLYERQEVLRTGRIMGFFTKKKTRFSVVLEKDKEEFNEDQVINELANLIKTNQDLTEIKKLGLSVAIVKRKAGIRIALVSIIS